MPYKFNETRRHKIPKAKYRVTNWPEYDAALVRSDFDSDQPKTGLKAATCREKTPK
jgi:5-methylcytosine-specific restriction endonuclease McrA